MNAELAKRIQANPKYKELVSKRTSFALKLGIFVLTMFYSYILVIAFNKELLGIKLNEAGVMTWAFPVAAAIIIISFITTIIYVRRANGEFDNLTSQIQDDVRDAL